MFRHPAEVLGAICAAAATAFAFLFKKIEDSENKVLAEIKATNTRLDRTNTRLDSLMTFLLGGSAGGRGNGTDAAS